MTKKRVNVRAVLSREEYDEFRKRRGDRKNRVLLLEAVGMTADHRPMGPKFHIDKFKFDRKKKKVGFKYGRDAED